MQNLGSDHPKKCKFSCLVGLLNEKQGSSFAHFLYLSNPLTLLTNCAMVGGFWVGGASITNIYRLKIGESGMGDLESGEKITGNG